jgi:hypothetical protein
MLGTICIAGLVAAFVLGWRLGFRRRERLIEAALVYSKNVPYKAHCFDPTHVPAQLKPGFMGVDPKPTSKLEVIPQGVIALHNSWRAKWHGQP